MGMLLGALAGAGAALDQVADHRLQQMDYDRSFAMKDLADREKEARIEEATIRQEGRNQTARIADEQRGITNKANERQADLEFNTDPNNVRLSANAKVTGQRIGDEYDDSRFDTKLSQAQRLDSVTDHTDYAGRNLDHQIKQAALAEAALGSKIPPAVIEDNKLIKEQLSSNKALRLSGNLDEKGMAALNEDDKALFAQMRQNLSPYLKTAEDPQGLFGGGNNKSTGSDSSSSTHPISKWVSSEMQNGKSEKDVLPIAIQKMAKEKNVDLSDINLSSASINDLRTLYNSIEDQPANTAQKPKNAELSRDDKIKEMNDRYSENAKRRSGGLLGLFLTPEEIEKQKAAREGR
jgi:hypothetical protein